MTARILVVDDEPDLEGLLVQKFRHQIREGKVEFLFARDGVEALAKLEENRDIDMVLTDINMPRMDGLSLLQKLQENEEKPSTIIVSAYGDMANIRTAMNRGAFDFLTKPIDFLDLEATIAKTLQHVEFLREARRVNAHLARLEAELEAARKLQMAMVPRSFPIPSADFPIELAASMEPAREVGGDLYDFFTTPDGILCFLVGDVSGKGMPAALLMARAKSLIHIATELMRAKGVSARPSDIIARVNRELCRDNSDMMFITLFFAMLEPQTGALEFCNAGHNAPYRINDEGLQAIEGVKGLVLGIQRDAAYATGHLSLTPGECVFVFTDGVTEANDPWGEMFSEARLEAVLRGSYGRSSAQVLETVAARLRGFVGSAASFDDITMMAVRRL